MSRVLRLWPVLLRIGFSGAVAYRAEMVIWFLTTTMPLVMLALWSAAAGDAPIEGFGRPEFVTYFAIALVVRQLSSAWVVWELNADIRTGALSMGMLRPINPLAVYVAENLGAIPMRIVVLVPIVATLLWALPAARAAFDPLHIALVLWTTAGAWLLAFTAQTIVGLLSLWTEQSLSIWDAWFGLFALLSGYLIPIELFPEGLRAVPTYLPFRSMAGLPIEILMGRLNGTGLVHGVLIQAAWIALFGALARLTWRRGIRRFGAYGQ